MIEALSMVLMDGEPCKSNYVNPSYICNHMGKAIHEAVLSIGDFIPPVISDEDREWAKNNMHITGDPFDQITLIAEDAEKEFKAVMNMLANKE